LSKINLKGLTLGQLEDFMKQIGEPTYRAKQIFKWIYKGQTQFEKMTDLPKILIDKLNKCAYISMLDIYKKYESDLDGTVKYVFLLEDGNMVESVKMKYSFGATACISSQVGCSMGCTFCASTEGGNKNSREKVSRVVVMGSGEPLLNYDELIQFLKVMNMPIGLNMSFRRMTVSTCGIVPEISRLADEAIPITLAVSLHAPNDEIRNSLMPINRRYSILQLLDACKYYIMKTKRRITFEYAMISEVNDTEECAHELSNLLRDILCHVNLIPLNPVEGKTYKRSNPSKVRRFEKILSANGISATVRRELGSDIQAACGQLRRSLLTR